MDIVKRLRAMDEKQFYQAPATSYRDCQEAADEIEKLRTALDDAANLVEKFSGADAVYPEGMRMIADNIRASKAKNFG